MPIKHIPSEANSNSTKQNLHTKQDVVWNDADSWRWNYNTLNSSALANVKKYLSNWALNIQLVFKHDGSRAVTQDVEHNPKKSTPTWQNVLHR
jgi:hypothetical protein